MNIRPFESLQTLHQATAQALADVLQTANDTPTAVMLSGGNTPLPAYEKLAQLKPTIQPNARIIFSDERHVPITSPDSNAGRILPLFIQAGLTEEQALCVPTTVDLEQAAAQFDATLQTFFDAGGRIPFGLLGLGSDGHTASLFNADDIARGQGKWAIPVTRETPPHRISVTADFLKRIEHIVFLVTGTDKADIIETLLKKPERVTAGVAVQGAPRVELWTCP